MTDNKKNTQDAQGPQGTQVFELDEINKMVADEIMQSQSAEADTPALIGISSNVAGMQFILDKPKLEVGRRANADISLKDKSVSSMHAHLICDEGQWKVLNLLSSNGTFVNGKKVAEQAINIGDRIAFGGAEFVFALIEKKTEKKHSSGYGVLAAVGIVMLLALAGILYFLL